VTTIIRRFETVKRTAVRKLVCVHCGRRFRRQRTFTNTINPYNRNPDGSIRTRREVEENVARLAGEWDPEPICGCEPGTGYR
jgi:hypothetical protein